MSAITGKQKPRSCFLKRAFSEKSTSYRNTFAQDCLLQPKLDISIWHTHSPLSLFFFFVFCFYIIHCRTYLRLQLLYILFIYIYIYFVGRVYFSFYLYFLQSKAPCESLRLKGTCNFLHVSLLNLFLLHTPGEITLLLRICKGDIFPLFLVIKKYLFFCHPESVKWNLRVFLLFFFVTKLYVFCSFC